MPHPTLRSRQAASTRRTRNTTRLVGAGWTWECDCGEKGSWHSKREEAMDRRVCIAATSTGSDEKRATRAHW